MVDVTSEKWMRDSVQNVNDDEKGGDKMFTELLFIVSFVLFLRLFKSRRTRIFIGFLYSLLLVWFVFSVLNYGKYTLQPGQSVSLRVNPRTQDLEYYSIFILKKNDSIRIKLTGSDVWSERNGDVYYGVEEQKIIKSHGLDEEDEELPNTQPDIYLVKDGVVVSYQGEKVFDATNNKPYTITITNVDNQPAQFEAQVVDK